MKISAALGGRPCGVNEKQEALLRITLLSLCISSWTRTVNSRERPPVHCWRPTA